MYSWTIRFVVRDFLRYWNTVFESSRKTVPRVESKDVLRRGSFCAYFVRFVSFCILFLFLQAIGYVPTSVRCVCVCVCVCVWFHDSFGLSSAHAITTTGAKRTVKAAAKAVPKAVARFFFFSRQGRRVPVYWPCLLNYLFTGWAKKTGLFFRLDNFVTVSHRKACSMSKFSQFYREKGTKLAFQCI